MPSSAPALPSNPAQDRGPTVLGFLIGFTLAAVPFVALRLSIRIHRSLLGWDDVAISVAMVRHPRTSPPSCIDKLPDRLNMHVDLCIDFYPLWLWKASR